VWWNSVGHTDVLDSNVGVHMEYIGARGGDRSGVNFEECDASLSSRPRLVDSRFLPRLEFDEIFVERGQSGRYTSASAAHRCENRIGESENKNKKFKLEARMANDKVLGDKDVPLDDHDHLSKDIIRLVDGTMVVSVVDVLSSD
jgi:hypothetical protein